MVLVPPPPMVLLLLLLLRVPFWLLKKDDLDLWRPLLRVLLRRVPVGVGPLITSLGFPKCFSINIATFKKN